MQAAIMAFLFQASQPVSAEEEVRTAHRFITAKLGDKWGLLDRDGTVILPFEYDYFGVDENGELVVGSGDSRGKADRDGRIFIPANHPSVAEFNGSGFAVAGDYGNYVVIDRSNEVVLGNGFVQIRQFDGGRLFAVEDGEKWGVVSLDCEWVIGPGFYRIGRQALNGLTRAEVERGQVGFLDRSGDWAIPPGRFEDAGDFDEKGMASAKQGGKWGFINAQGDWLIQPQFESGWRPRNFDNEGYTAIELGGKTGVIDQAGRVVVEPRFKFVWQFENGIATAQIDEKSGRIDTAGEIVVPFQYDWITPYYGQGLARARMGTDWIHIDERGSRVMFEGIDEVMVFTEGGWAAARKDGKWGAIDVEGNWLVEPIYDCVDMCNVPASPPPPIMTVPRNRSSHPAYVTDPKGQEWCRLED